MNNELIAAIAEDHGLCTKVEGAGYKNDMLWFDGEHFEFAHQIATAERIEIAEAWEQKHGYDKHGVAEWLRSNVKLSTSQQRTEKL